MKVVIAILAVLLLAACVFLCVGFAMDWSFIPGRGGEESAPQDEHVVAVIGGEVVAPVGVVAGMVAGA